MDALLANAFEMERPCQAIAAVRAVTLEAGSGAQHSHLTTPMAGSVVRSPCAACEMCNTFAHLRQLFLLLQVLLLGTTLDGLLTAFAGASTATTAATYPL